MVKKSSTSTKNIGGASKSILDSIDQILPPI